MRILLFLLFFTAYSALSKPAQIDQLITLLPFEKSLKEEVNTEKVKPHEGVPLKELEIRESIWYLKDSETPYSGKVFRLYKNGQKDFEVNYKDGKREGLATAWHENGLKKTEGNYKDGKKDGLEIWWHEDGQKRKEINYKDGKLDGPMNAWHENGQKAVEGKNKDGKTDGLYVSWHKNGQKQAEGNFKEGNADGLFEAWHENGQKMSERNCKDGKEISAKYWNSKGEPVDSEEEAEEEAIKKLLNNP